MSLRFNLNFARLRARVDRLAREAPGLFEDAATRAMEPVREAAEHLALTRHGRNSPGGHATRFRTRVRRNGNAIRVFVENTAPYHRWVEEGRRPGQPVLKAYADTAQNRRLERVGGAYVSHYTGMPPAGIFGDSEPDWARRRKIARDGIPGKFIVRDVTAAFPRDEIMGSIIRRLKRSPEYRRWAR